MKNITKHIQKILCLIILILLTVNTFAQTQVIAPSQSEKLTVLLDWFINPSHATLFVAQEKGFFKEQNLDVELIGPADPTDPPKLVAARKADIAITYQPHLVLQIDQGLPLVMLGTLIDKPLTCLVVLKGGAIKSLANLKGKRIGTSSGGVNSVFLKTMLKSANLKLENVERINVHYNLSQALLTRKVDGITGVMRTFEVFQIEQEGQPVQAFYPEDYGIPNYSELVFAVHSSQFGDKRFAKFLTAIQKANHYLQLHPEACWAMFAKAYPENNNQLNHRAWLATLPYFSKNPAFINQKESLQLAQFLKQNGLLKQKR